MHPDFHEFCRGDPQAYLEYMHQAHAFATPRRFAAAVRASFEEYYNVAPAEMAVSAGKRHARAPHDVRERERCCDNLRGCFVILRFSSPYRFL